MERDPLTGGALPPRPAPRPAGARRGWWIVAAAGVVAAGGGVWAWRRGQSGDAAAVAPPSAVPASGSTATAPASTAPSRRVIVEVLNASGIRGLGRRATAYLREQGLDVVYTANAPDSLGRDSTLVLDRAGDADAAARVAAAMGGARVAARPDSSRYVHVTVLVGRLWRPPADALYP